VNLVNLVNLVNFVTVLDGPSASMLINERAGQPAGSPRLAQLAKCFLFGGGFCPMP